MISMDFLYVLAVAAAVVAVTAAVVAVAVADAAANEQ